MKVTSTEEEVGSTFPCLMHSAIEESTNLVVLFANRDTGTVIRGTDFHPVGKHSTTWVWRTFKPFKGTLHLSND